MKYIVIEYDAVTAPGLPEIIWEAIPEGTFVSKVDFDYMPRRKDIIKELNSADDWETK